MRFSTIYSKSPREVVITMNLRAFSIPTVLLTVLLLLIVGSLGATDIPDTVTMDSKAYTEHTRPLVTFRHKGHAEHKDIGCVDCHHVYEDGKNVWKEGDQVQKCEACHQNTERPPKGMKKEDKIKEFHKDALHANCRDCHKRMIDKQSELGRKLKTCTGCHAKEE
jgi:hypothetical protein